MSETRSSSQQSLRRSASSNPRAAKNASVAILEARITKLVKKNDALKKAKVTAQFESTMYKGMLYDSKRECLAMTEACIKKSKEVTRLRGRQDTDDRPLIEGIDFDQFNFQWMPPALAFAYISKISNEVKAKMALTNSSFAEEAKLLSGGAGPFRACLFFNQGPCRRGDAHFEQSSRYGGLIRLHVCVICFEVMGALTPHWACECPLLKASYYNNKVGGSAPVSE